MIARVARLIRAEFLKLAAQPFLYISLWVILMSILLGVWAKPITRAQVETPWRGFHAVQLFAYGFDWGIWMAGVVLVIFSSMMMAGEFDRGTIKNLLTRPITRTDFFVAKSVTVLVLGLGLFFFTLFGSLAYGLGRGELGPVWLSDQYVVQRSYEEIHSIAVRAVGICLVPFLAAGFLGLLISNWTESSGYAVAIALVIFLFGDLFKGALPYGAERWSFQYYAPYVLGKLQGYAEGGKEHWDDRIEAAHLYLKVPLLYIAGFLPVAYAIFRARNIKA